MKEFSFENPSLINKVYIGASDQNKFEVVYVQLSNGDVNKYDRGAASYEEFADEIKAVLAGLGYTNNDKDVKWEVNLIEKLPSEIVNAKAVEASDELDLSIEALETEVDGVSNVYYAADEFDEEKESKNYRVLKTTAVVVVLGTLVCVASQLAGCKWVEKLEDKLFGSDKKIEFDNGAIEGAEIGNVTVNASGEIIEENQTQKAFEEASLDFLLNFNRSEDWMYSEITGEMTEDLESMGLEVTGDEAIFGFTAEELNAFRLVYGNYTNDELVSITGGELVNVTDMINDSESDLNKAFRKIMLAYWNTDKENLDIVNLAGFSDEELDRIHHYEGYLYTFKNLVKDGKDKEAYDLMREVRKDIYEYGFASNEGQDKAKSYILKTLLPSFSVYSQMYQYQDTVTLHLYNSETNTYEDKEVKTQLFDEVMMRGLVEGYNGCRASDDTILLDAFDTIEYLKKFNIDTNKYALVISDDGISKADQFNDGLVNHLEEFNTYLAQLRNENSMADGAATDNSIKPIDNNSVYDSLTRGTKPLSEMNKLINEELVENEKYPKNTSFFSSIYSKFVSEFMMAKGILDANGNFIGDATFNITNVKGSYRIVVETHDRTVTRTERFTVKEKVSDADIAAKEAEAVNNALKTTVIDGATGNGKLTTYQDIYNKVWNDKAVQSKQPTNLDDDDQIRNEDTIAKTVTEWANEDAADNVRQNYEASQGATSAYTDSEGNNHYISGGETTRYVDSDADTVSESEAEAYNRRLQEQQNQSSNEAPVVNEPVTQPETPVVEAPSGYSSYTDASSASGFAPVIEETSEAEINEEIGRTY